VGVGAEEDEKDGIISEYMLSDIQSVPYSNFIPTSLEMNEGLCFKGE